MWASTAKPLSSVPSTTLFIVKRKYQSEDKSGRVVKLQVGCRWVFNGGNINDITFNDPPAVGTYYVYLSLSMRIYARETADKLQTRQ